ncbi:MAG TPA: aromatic ring-hydroxylating dioxygenase subunit alpha [Candidatus Sulfotelmatobacter sp.]|nr:aromatic ring-hydroxylating dioxygenase subunit alpha [Candidatus Sulfotelmatobacter sp.]
MLNLPSLLNSDLHQVLRHAILEDRSLGAFKVNRRLFTDEAVLAAERRLIFDHCWLYLGHISEVPKPGSFVTRAVGGRPLIFNRGRDGKVQAFFNTCSHRGALVCRERHGQRRSFQCPYHGWVYSDQGVLIDVPGKDAITPGLIESGQMNLPQVAKVGEYCGFVFINFDRDAMPLETYLADARSVLELVSEQSAVGMEIVGGTQEYSVNANWKLLQENSADGYHAATTHATYFDYVLARDGKTANAMRMASPGGGSGPVRGNSLPPGDDNGRDNDFNRVRDLGNGHAVIASIGSAPWGRPYARWVPGWGEEAKVEIDEIARGLIDRLGPRRAELVINGDRNTLIFPNLVINDIMAITIRTFYPVRPDHMEVNAWALAPIGESASSRDRRLCNFLEFLGPAGFASPDDVEMLEMCQAGYRNQIGTEWNDISKGMLKNHPTNNDEEQMRIFWRRWRDLMAAAADN